MGAAVLLLSDDLLDTSRVSAAGRSHGIALLRARDLDGLVALARQESPRLVLVDLANPGLSVTSLIEALRAACPVMPRVVAYGPHVDAAGLRAARQAGCDPVLPRSAFVEQLPARLPDWLAPPPAPTNSDPFSDREE
jgi:DNA-binding NarL/FixJ family response regulator